MKRKRRQHSPEFKARVALEALKEEKSLTELAKEFELAPAQITEWKTALKEGMGSIFERKNAADKELKRREKRTETLERKVGQLSIEKDFLVKKCKQLGIDLSESP